MAFQIVWSEIALADLRDLVRYIARDDRQVARRFGDLIVSKVESLQTFPRIGRDRAGISGGVPAGTDRYPLSNRFSK